MVFLATLSSIPGIFLPSDWASEIFLGRLGPFVPKKRSFKPVQTCIVVIFSEVAF